MGKYFGTDGIRGEVNQGALTSSMVLRVGQAFGVYLRQKIEKPKVLIGKDTRISGYMLEGALASGLCSVGCDVFFVGPLPTPGIAYLTRGMRASAGIVISASHNPYYDNGIKLFDADGFKFPDAVEAEIEALMDSLELESYGVHASKLGRATRIDDAIGQYAVFLKEQFPKKYKLDSIRIVLDCAHGAAYKVAPKVFRELGAEVFCIHDQPNGQNINQDAGALYSDILKSEVIRYRANIGIALDGDADRIIIVDEKGSVLDGDQILAMSAINMKNNGVLDKNTLVVTVMSNKGLDLSMSQAGIQVVRTPVGDRYVVEQMRKGGYVLGGEQSGHLLFLNSSTTGDGVLAALKVLELMVSTGHPVSSLAQVMTRFPQLTRTIPVSSKPPLELLPEVTECIKEIENVLGDQGRVLVRYSGTERAARITLEGPISLELVNYADRLEKALLSEIARYGRNDV